VRKSSNHASSWICITFTAALCLQCYPLLLDHTYILTTNKSTRQTYAFCPPNRQLPPQSCQLGKIRGISVFNLVSLLSWDELERRLTRKFWKSGSIKGAANAKCPASPSLPMIEKWDAPIKTWRPAWQAARECSKSLLGASLAHQKIPPTPEASSDAVLHFRQPNIV
jgi:hypothetical protein